MEFEGTKLLSKFEKHPQTTVKQFAGLGEKWKVTQGLGLKTSSSKLGGR